MDDSFDVWMKICNTLDDEQPEARFYPQALQMEQHPTRSDLMNWWYSGDARPRTGFFSRYSGHVYEWHTRNAMPMTGPRPVRVAGPHPAHANSEATEKGAEPDDAIPRVQHGLPDWVSQLENRIEPASPLDES